ncbi:hypothetical protein ACP70R_047775 [Stipagrostis hirtigluma subsp. patula]
MTLFAYPHPDKRRRVRDCSNILRPPLAGLMEKPKQEKPKKSGLSGFSARGAIARSRSISPAKRGLTQLQKPVRQRCWRNSLPELLLLPYTSVAWAQI